MCATKVQKRKESPNLILPFQGSMSEKLLQFIWQHQYFNHSHLESTTGDKLEVLDPGMCNSNQGPDFAGARVRIGSAVLAGSVELHVRTSEWDRHGHSHDGNYKNVILHV